MVILFCTVCPYSSRSPLNLANHAESHSLDKYFCGVNLCEKHYGNLKSLKNHLRIHHPDFFPNFSVIPTLSSSSIFSFSQHTPTIRHEYDSIPDNNGSFGQPEIIDFPQQPSPSNNSNLEDRQLQDNIEKFLQIMIQHGIRYNIPFNCLSSLTTNVINLFESLQESDQVTNDFLYASKQSISSSDTFDFNLESKFGAVFPEIIDIYGSEEFFGYVPIKKSINFLLKKFDAFSKFTVQHHNNPSEKITSFFTTPYPRKNDCIYLNIFLDDFQLAKPLHRKSTEKTNSITGIYYRIITIDNLDYASKQNICPLALVKTKTFKTYMTQILEFIGKEIQKCSAEKVVLSIDNETKSLSVEIGFFSADSKGASEVLGVKQGFSHENCCRFCTIPRSGFNSTFSEDISLCKTLEFYREALLQIGHLDPGQDYFGVTSLSPMRFFGTENFFCMFPPCLDHDIFEGVFPAVLKF